MQWVVYTALFIFLILRENIFSRGRRVYIPFWKMLRCFSELLLRVRWRETFGTNMTEPEISYSPFHYLSYVYTFYIDYFFFYFASRIMKTAFGSLSILSLYFSLYVIFFLQFPSFSSRNTCYLYVLRRRYAFVIIVSRFPVFRDSSEVISFFLFIHDISRSLYLQLHQIMRTKRCDLRMRILQVTLLSTKLWLDIWKIDARVMVR